MALLSLDQIPSASSFVRGVNVASAITSAFKPSCSFTQVSNIVAVIAKPTNTNLPLYLPVQNADVEIEAGFPERGLFQTAKRTIKTNTAGIAVVPCADVLISFTYRVRADNVNFGNGFGNFSSPETRYTGKDIPIVFKGDINIPCDTGYLTTPIPSGFNSLVSVPSINIGVPAFNMSGYGIINPPDISTGIPISIYINDQRVFSTTATSNRNTVFNLPATLTDILSGTSPFSIPLTPGGRISIYTIATLGNCQKRSQTLTLTLPSLPTLKAICSRLITKVAGITPPSILDPLKSNILNISGIQQVCETDPTNPAFIKTYGTSELSGANVGTISLDTQSAKFSVQNGFASIDLSKIFNLAALFQSLQISAPSISAPALLAPAAPTAPSAVAADKTTRFRDSGISFVQIQAYLPPGYIVEPSTFGGIGTYKITRPNSTYFYAQSFGDIDRSL